MASKSRDFSPYTGSFVQHSYVPKLSVTPKIQKNFAPRLRLFGGGPKKSKSVNFAAGMKLGGTKNGGF